MVTAGRQTTPVVAEGALGESAEHPQRQTLVRAVLEALVFNPTLTATITITLAVAAVVGLHLETAAETAVLAAVEAALHRLVLLEPAVVQPVIPVLLEPQALLGLMVVLAAQILVVVVVLAIQHTPGQRATAAPA
jgi:hypothetical protein